MPERIPDENDPLEPYLRIPARPFFLRRVLSFVLNAAQKAGVGRRRTAHLELAAEEVFVNICAYAYLDRQGEVRISTADSPAMFRVFFSDDGVPFDPTRQKVPASARHLLPGADRRKAGGLGLLLTGFLMTEMLYERTGNSNTLILGIAKD